MTTANVMPGVPPTEFIGVFQRNVSNVDGDCVSACFASALGMAYEALPRISMLEGEEVQAWAAWRSWLQGYGIDLDIWLLANRGNWRPDGWWIGALTVTGDIYHAALYYRDRFMWDPRPGYGPLPGTGGRVIAGYALVPAART